MTSSNWSESTPTSGWAACATTHTSIRAPSLETIDYR